MFDGLSDAASSVLSTCGEPAPKGVMGTPAGTGTTRQTGRREQSGVTADPRSKPLTCTRVRSQQTLKPMPSKTFITNDNSSSTVVGGHRLRSRRHLSSTTPYYLFIFLLFFF